MGREDRFGQRKRAHGVEGGMDSTGKESGPHTDAQEESMVAGT